MREVRYTAEKSVRKVNRYPLAKGTSVLRCAGPCMFGRKEILARRCNLFLRCISYENLFYICGYLRRARAHT